MWCLIAQVWAVVYSVLGVCVAPTATRVLRTHTHTPGRRLFSRGTCLDFRNDVTGESFINPRVTPNYLDSTLYMTGLKERVVETAVDEPAGYVWGVSVWSSARAAPLGKKKQWAYITAVV